MLHMYHMRNTMREESKTPAQTVGRAFIQVATLQDSCLNRFIDDRRRLRVKQL